MIIREDIASEALWNMDLEEVTMQCVRLWLEKGALDVVNIHISSRKKKTGLKKVLEIVELQKKSHWTRMVMLGDFNQDCRQQFQDLGWQVDEYSEPT